MKKRQIYILERCSESVTVIVKARNIGNVAQIYDKTPNNIQFLHKLCTENDFPYIDYRKSYKIPKYIFQEAVKMFKSSKNGMQYSQQTLRNK